MIDTRIKGKKMLFLCAISYLTFSMHSFSFAMGIWQPKAKESPMQLKDAEDFTLLDLENNIITLSEFRGKKVVLLTFWNSECRACIDEIALLKEIYSKYNDKGAEILAVNIGENRERLNRFKEKTGINYRILLDTKASVAGIYKVVLLPTNVIIDRQGKIRYYGLGWPANLEDIIKGLLK